MRDLSHPFVLRLGATADGEAVPLEFDERGIGLWVVGERLPVLALARTLMVRLAAQSSDLPLLRADDRITIGEVPIVALAAGVAGRPPPATGVPRLTIDDVPWARLDADTSLRLRCELTSRAEFPAALRAARMRSRAPRGRHARADENGSVFAASTLIS